jgi:hypothetical protein
MAAVRRPRIENNRERIGMSDSCDIRKLNVLRLTESVTGAG